MVRETLPTDFSAWENRSPDRKYFSEMEMNYEQPAGHEKKIFPMGDFLKLMPIFSINNFVNPFEGCSLISYSASVRQGFRNFTSELAYPNPEEFLQFLS